MNQAITTVDDKEFLFDPRNITKDTIKKYLCPTATDQELMMGLQVAKTFKLNPLKREIYFVKYGNNPMSVLTGYEVYLKRAEDSTQWAGMKVWSEGSVADGNLKGCIEVYRKDWTIPLSHEVDYAEYVQHKSDGTVNKFWKGKPKTMIKKVAVSQAFRMAFPKEFDGMPYTSDEAVDQESIIDIKTGPEQYTSGKPVITIQPKAIAQNESTTEKAFDDEVPVFAEKKKTADKLISGEHKAELTELGKKCFKTAKQFKDWINLNFKVDKVSLMNEWQYEDAVALLLKEASR